MKIYYKVRELKADCEELDALNDTIYKNFFIGYRYRLMWNLRFLESEINEQKGMIVVDKDLNTDIQGFTNDLTTEILSICERCRLTDKDI